MAVKPYRVDGTDMHHARTLTPEGLARAQEEGLRFLIHKTTQGLRFVDPKYDLRRIWAKEISLHFGGYHWLDEGDPVKQMEHFLSRLKIEDGDWRPSIDFEDPVFNSWSKERKTDHLGRAVAKIKSEVGTRPIVYTKFELLDSFRTMLWAPRYHNLNKPPNHEDGTLAKPWSAPRIIQFSNGVFGVPNTHPGLGPMDLNQLVLEGPEDSLEWFLVNKSKPPVVEPPVVVIPPVVKPPVVKPTTLKFDVGLLPSKNNPDMARSKVLADGKEANSLLGSDGVLFTTEIGEASDFVDLEAGLGKGWRRTHANATPIYLGSKWVLADGYREPFTIRLHGGRRGVSPHRDLNVTYAKLKTGGPVFGLLGTHLVSEAWCTHKKLGKQWRKDMWLKSWSTIVEEVARIHAAGVPIIFCGDLNTGRAMRGSKLTLHPKAIHVVNDTLDHIFIVPTNDVPMKSSGHIERDINSDHNFHRVTIEVR